ncbi:MAG: hypothetical protein JWN14_2237, partial [Chthonomonadales bacterium]|nr:hypothetical protein [Chthonomonadales bacterium]
MSAPIRTDICVLGGGPAGAAIARRLALLGHEVWIVERAQFPRAHIGESLTPGILPLLDLLGVRSRVEEAEFLRPDAAMIRWEDATEMRALPAGERGFQVDRGRFDALLLEAACEAGAQLLQPAIAGKPVREGAQQWRVPLRFQGQDLLLQARFVVDATGRRATLGGPKRRSGTPTLALFAYWKQAGMMGSETRVEAGREAWFWGAPLPDGTFNATVFLDPKRGVGHTRHDLENLYRNLLAESSLLGGCLEGVPAGEMVACNATTYQDPQPVGEDFLKVGEASFSIDPLSSQGVQ